MCRTCWNLLISWGLPDHRDLVRKVRTHSITSCIFRRVLDGRICFFIDKFRNDVFFLVSIVISNLPLREVRDGTADVNYSNK